MSKRRSNSCFQNELDKTMKRLCSDNVNIAHMRCGVHTLQLAVRDGLHNTHSANLISRARQIAKAARTPKLMEVLKNQAAKVAILGQETRWGSTCLML